jgi:PKD domain
MLTVLMLPRPRRPFFLGTALAAVVILSASCEKVPLLAPTGSSITLTASTTALSANGTALIIAQVLEAAGTPPHTGTHVSFVTTLGKVEPSEVETDVSGKVTATFIAGGSNGTATITALSGGATTGTAGGLKILVGTAAVGRVTANASPAVVPAIGGSSTVTTLVLDVNGNALVGTPVSFTTTAGTLSSTVVITDGNGVAASVLTTSTQATVTATVGAQVTTTTGTGTGTTTSSSGQASATVTVNVAGAPSITITAPTATIFKGLPATFTFTVTAAAANGSAVRDVTVDWGDGLVQSLGSFTGANTSSHTYAHDGGYLVKATVVDAAGNSNSTSSTIVVLLLPRPTVVVTYTPVAAQPAGTTLTFTVTITLPTGVALQSTVIDYGDGVTQQLGGAATATVTHSYSTAGTKAVTVTVVDTSGQSTPGTTTVVVL